MSLQPFGSSETAAFDLLHPGVQKWIYREGWNELRDVQGDAILAIYPGGQDVLVSAPTAAGKTEAAFLPLLSRILLEEKRGIRAVYVGPLKALINDQFARLEGLCEELEIQVHPWHGDVSASRKAKLRKAPSGIVLITPESLEALFVNHGSLTPTMFSGLEGIVVDEVHSFIGSERGAQLQSLLHRVEIAANHRVDRIGLSATLGSPRLAADFLRPNSGDKVKLIESSYDSGSLRALVVGVQETSESTNTPPALKVVADHLYSKMRGRNNLVFANSRKRVEELGDLLVQMCEATGVPIEFGAHHGSLSKEIRLDAEGRLKDGGPFTVVCTSTLEMGIDIGNMHSVGQVGVPPSVSSLRQRVGRSGRRGGEPPTLWMYSIEKPLDERSTVRDELREGLFQQSAMLELMVARWCEPPRDTALHLSTMIQQCLSAVAERGGMSPLKLYQLLCHGPFSQVDQPTFVQLLRCLGERRVLVSAEDGVLLPGEVGEKMLAHYGFYSAFASPIEFRILCEGRTLGTLPIDGPIRPEGYIVFAARRWLVTEVDEKSRVIAVTKAKAGKAPSFSGDGLFGTAEEVRLRMRDLYRNKNSPAYLDSGATRLLDQGRKSYLRLGLEGSGFVRDGTDALVFLWTDDFSAITIALALQALGHDVSGDGLALEAKDTSVDDLIRAVLELSERGIPEASEIAGMVSNKMHEKHDHLLAPPLLELDYASRFIDVSGAEKALAGLRARCIGAPPPIP